MLFSVPRTGINKLNILAISTDISNILSKRVRLHGEYLWKYVKTFSFTGYFPNNGYYQMQQPGQQMQNANPQVRGCAIVVK